MGLLNRARVLDDAPGAAGGRSPDARAKAVLERISHSEDQLDFPVEVFNSFRTVLGFSRGSLLFTDRDRGEFYPWIASGLDRTTIRRLRIPEDFPPLHRAGYGSLIRVESEELAPMLSNRESGLAGPIHLVLLGSEGDTSGLMLAMDARIGDPEAMGAATSTLNDGLGHRIGISRKLLEDLGSDDPVDPEEWLDGWGDRDAWLLTLDATGAIESLMEAIEGLEIYRARKDVIGLIRRINGRMGRTYDLKDGRVLILFPAERMPDRDLYLHQLSISFCASVKRLPDPPEFPVEIHRWPAEKDEVKTALSGYFGGE